MISEQLQTVRAERWRQKSNPILNLEDASAWLNTTGLCLFLPRRNQFLAPAPSFVEACSGEPSETPSRESIENASGLMIRLIEDGAVLPLNLFGTFSEQPDFLVTREAFPYIFSLRGGRSWKVVPAKATPLVAEIWKLLEKEATLEASEIQAALGRELTEAAVLRGLMDLWSTLRVMPVFSPNQPTRWELTQTRFSDALTAANKVAQTTSLSALVSLYLESVLAATTDEVETFLSPLTSRSKVREVVNGLAATRQVSIIPVGTQLMFHVAGSLPEFAEPEPPAVTEIDLGNGGARPRFDRARPSGDARGSERRPSFGRDRTGDRPRPSGDRPRPSGDRPQRAGSDRPRTGPPRERFAAGGDRPRPRPAGGAGRSSDRPLRSGTDSRGNYPPRRKSFGAKPGGFSKPGSDRPYRKPADGEDRPRTYTPRSEGSGERKPYTKRPFDKSSGPSKPYGERSAGGGSSRSPRTNDRTSSGQLRPGTGRPGTGRPSSRPEGGKFPPRKFSPSGDRPSSGRPFTGRPSGDRPWKDRDSAPSRPRSTGGAGDRPFRPRREEGSDRPRSPRPYDRATGSGRPSGPSRSYGAGKPREEGKRPFFRDKSPKPPFEGGSRPRTFTPRSGEGAAPRSGGGDRSSGGWKPRSSGTGGGFSKPAFGKSGGKFGGSKPSGPGGSRGSSTGGKKFGGASSGYKSGSGSKFGSKPPSKFGPKSGPKFGSKPGGSRPPFKKRRDEGKKDSE